MTVLLVEDYLEHFQLVQYCFSNYTQKPQKSLESDQTLSLLWVGSGFETMKVFEWRSRPSPAFSAEGRLRQTSVKGKRSADEKT